MFQTVLDQVFSFDVEWIPDPLSARILCGASGDSAGETEDAFRRLWERAGATEEDPQPFLKTILCRIVSLAGILRVRSGKSLQHKLVSLPANPDGDPATLEAEILNAFLAAVGRRKPQLVGYNSAEADVAIIVQRSIVHGLTGQGFTRRPNKPWEGVDYFSTFGEGHIDLAQLLGRYRQTPSLHEAASLCGIPGKIETSGGAVSDLWLQGRLRDIIAYNEFDAFTTHLLWARVALFAGALSEAEHLEEERAIHALLQSEIEGGRTHLARYLEEWKRLRALTGQALPED